MIFDDEKFELVEKKIDEIRGKIDKGLMDPGLHGALASAQLRAARAELFKLRELLHTSIDIEPSVGPTGGPEAA